MGKQQGRLTIWVFAFLDINSPPVVVWPAVRLALNSWDSHFSSRDPREENWANRGDPWK